MSWLKAIAIGTFAILAPIHTVMAATGALIVIDLTLGVVAARKRKEPITSAALRRTVSKMLVYQLAIISAFLLEHYMLSDALPVVKLCAGAIGISELKSILENADSINGTPILAAILTKLGSQNDTKDSS